MPATEQVGVSHGLRQGAYDKCQAWADRTSPKKISPAPGIKFIGGWGQRVYKFFKLIVRSFKKMLALKILKYVSGLLYRLKHFPMGLFYILFFS
jgi:hypothetical protein